MSEVKKILIAGVGGQGVVYLTNLLVEAATGAGLTVATSEIHGLAQRSGSVVSGVTFGDAAFGFVEKGGVDFLLGLESLEAQRCLPYLNRGSRAVIDDKRILPYSVNAGVASYPDVDAFVGYLRENIAEVVFGINFDSALNPILRNICVLGRATLLDGFPLSAQAIEETLATFSKEAYREQSLKALRLGCEQAA